MAKRKKTPEVLSVEESGTQSAIPKSKSPKSSRTTEFKMTSKISFFIHYYIDNGGNAARAYMKAYNCSYDSARDGGSRLLADPCIKEIIEDRQREIEEKLHYTREKWLRSLVAMATSSPLDREQIEYDTEGKLIHPGDKAYGLDCKASDRKAAMDELRDVLGLKNATDTGIKESTVREVLELIRVREGK